MEHVITRYLLTNIPLILVVLALIFGAGTIFRHKESVSSTFVFDTFAGYFLFFVVGIGGLWLFCMNIVFSHILAGFTKWTFTEGAMQLTAAGGALGLGIAGIFALGESFGFKVATTIVATGYFWGMTVEQIRHIPQVPDFRFGAPFYVTLIVPFILIILLLARHAAEKR